MTTVLAFACLFFIRRAVNPTWINHLVIICDDPDMCIPPLQATLDGSTMWSQELDIQGGHHHGPGSSRGSLLVANISGAWSEGVLTISDGNRKELAKVEVQWARRYYGTLVIHIDANGKTHTAWNSMPHE